MAGDAGDRYRLAAVRDARARDEQGKRGSLAAAVADTRRAQARLDAARSREQAAREALAAAVATWEQECAGATTPVRLARAEQFVTRRRGELERATAETARAEAALAAELGTVDRARQTLARARADRELVDRHHTAWQDARRKLAERRED